MTKPLSPYFQPLQPTSARSPDRARTAWRTPTRGSGGGGANLVRLRSADPARSTPAEAARRAVAPLPVLDLDWDKLPGETVVCYDLFP